MKIKEFLHELIEKKKEEAEEILLIHVDSFYNLLYSFYNLGLLSIGTLLKAKGFSVRCITSGNLFFISSYKLRAMIQKFSPRLVGFYVNSDNIHNVTHFSRDIKSWVPGVRIVVGGPLATVLGEKILEDTPFDFAVSGEGEYAMLGLAEYYLRGKGTLKDIAGLIYRQGGEVLVNRRAAPLRNMDELPPADYSLIDVSYGFFYSTGRGCPHKCAFCFQEVHGKGYRFFSAPRVVRDIVANVEKYKALTVNIVDDTFVAEPKRVDEICAGLVKERKERKLDFVFFCEGRVDIFDRHPDLIERLKEAGMARLQIGVESGDQEMLDRYHKHIRLEQVERVIERVARVGGVSVYGNFIIGGPFESEKTFEKTLAFAKKLLTMAPGQFECSSSYLCPFPGTEIGEDPSSFGLTIIDREWRRGLTMSDVSCTTVHLGKDRLRELQAVFSSELAKEMRKIAMNLDPAMMEHHFMWALRYKMHTLYYLDVFSAAPILESYFTVKKSTRFRRFADIPKDQLLEWFPFRILERRLYSSEGGMMVLPGYFRKVSLTKPVDIAIYEYSGGKMPLGEIAARISGEFGGTSDEVLRRFMIPLFKKLEKTYHIIFYR
ncbi:MAG: radical SAM protein [Candidatus Eremiobacteraeota bacterium]|nr:radical SAM protein [Candidatus Eremiobacteraeota bacterium]